MPLENHFIHLLVLVDHAWKVAHKNTFVLVSPDRISILYHRAALNQIVREVCNEFKQIFESHCGTIDFNIHQPELPHAKRIEAKFIL